MNLLIAGLVIFLGTHSVRIFAPSWCDQKLQALGEKMFKGMYTVASLVGFLLLIYGYNQARLTPQVIWSPPFAMRYVNLFLMWVSMILLCAAFVKNNGFKARLGHPMVLSVKVWALSHLLVNGNLEEIILFGGFLIWSVLCFRSLRQRDRMANANIDSSIAKPNWINSPAWRCLFAATLIWSVMVRGGHLWMFGVSPLT